MLAEHAPSPLSGALDAAGRGWKVIRLEPAGKVPHGRWRGHETSDPGTIRSWFRGDAEPNYGIVADASGLLILDEDTPGALDAWAASAGVDLPDTFTVATGKGRHRYYVAGGVDYGNGTPFKAAGFDVDVRGAGYVVGPGSVHGATGALYAVTDDRAPVPVPVPLHDYLTHASERPVERPAAPERGSGASGLGPWLTAAVSGVLGDLAALQAVPAGAEPRWDRATYAGARRLVELSNGSHGTYPLEQARADYLAAAPTDATFGPAQHLHKWDDAVQAGGSAEPPALRPDDRLTAAEAADLTGAETGSALAATGGVDDASAAQIDKFELAVADEVLRQRVRDEARRRVAAQAAEATTLPPLSRLDDFLAEQDPPVAFRVDGLWPVGGRVVLAAQQKAGKTTTLANVLRVLVDGGDLFDRFPAEPVRRVILIDNELSPHTLRRWLRDQGIVNTHRVELVSLRGRLSTFNILEASTRERWAEHLSDADVLLFDCLRPALDALGLDENHDAGRFLEAFDELLAEARIDEGMVVHHMGHSGERSRGDSRILDWPDAIWRLLREDSEDPASARYFAAHGRDVDVRESRLSFDAESRQLTVEGGSRSDRKVEAALEEVIDLVERLAGQGSPPSGRQIESELIAEHPQKVVRSAVKLGVSEGVLRVHDGPRRAKLYTVGEVTHTPSASVRHSASTVRQRAGGECVSASIEDALHSHHATRSEGREADALKQSLCPECGGSLPEAVIAEGFTTHPACDGGAR